MTVRGWALNDMKKCTLYRMLRKTFGGYIQRTINSCVIFQYSFTDKRGTRYSVNTSKRS